jgi:hypothetical protein
MFKRSLETEGEKNNLPRAGLVLLGKSTVSFAGSSVGFFPIEMERGKKGRKNRDKEFMKRFHMTFFILQSESEMHK